MSKLESSLGRIKVSSPSNIAFVKYWGKKPIQLALNPSLSMTLNKSHSVFDIEFSKRKSVLIESFKFEGEENPKFKERMSLFLESLISELPFLSEYSLCIDCSNSFPHSSGIASSASSMSALIFGILSFENKNSNSSYTLKDMSHYSRLGSGSACRSLYAAFSLWGECSLEGSSSEHAIAFDTQHKVFNDMHDAILIIDKGVKKVSSTQGHRLMNNHVYKDIRIKQAQVNTEQLLLALQEGDVKEFGRILEEEALSLHALMMTSSPSFILMKPNTLKAIELIREFREKSKLDLYFTLDAGANLHLLYLGQDKERVESFINSSLKCICEDEQIIFDRIGHGPVILELSL